MNLMHFDKVVVVTAPEDKRTPKLCSYWGAERGAKLQCHITDAFQSRWGHFCKGKGINEALDQFMDKDAWICHMDADIALPPITRGMLDRAKLDTGMIYGIDRVDCKSWLDWQKFISDPEPIVQGLGFMIHTTHSPFKLATRVAFPHSGGYIPIGFFQL